MLANIGNHLDSSMSKLHAHSVHFYCPPPHNLFYYIIYTQVLEYRNQFIEDDELHGSKRELKNTLSKSVALIVDPFDDMAGNLTGNGRCT